MYRLETKRVSGRAEGDSVAEGVDGGSDQAQRTSSRWCPRRTLDRAQPRGDSDVPVFQSCEGLTAWCVSPILAVWTLYSTWSKWISVLVCLPMILISYCKSFLFILKYLDSQGVVKTLQGALLTSYPDFPNAWISLCIVRALGTTGISIIPLTKE